MKPDDRRMSDALWRLASTHDPVHGLPGETRREWAELWQKSLELPLAEIGLADLVMLCSLGWSLAVQHRDWRAAEERIERFFQHPRHQTESRATLMTFRCELAAVKLPLEREDEAIEECRDVLDEAQGHDRRLALLLLRNLVLGFVDAQDADVLASESLSRFTWDLAAEFQGGPRRDGVSVDSARRFGELATLLDQTFGIGPKRRKKP